MPDPRASTEDLVLRYERMLGRLLDVPVALVSVGDADTASEQDGALRTLVQRAGKPVLLESLDDDEAAPLGHLGLASYVGWPLLDAEGRTIGSLAGADHRPRHWTREDLDTLADLAESCSGELAHRTGREQAERQAERARELTRRSRVLLALSEGLSSTRTLDDIAYAVEQVAVEQLDCLHGGIWLLRRARDAADTDRMRYISDPMASWSSAALNSDLAVADDNPLGDVLLTGRALAFADRDEQNARYPTLDYSEQVGQTRYFMPLGLGRTFGVLALIWAERQTLSPEHRVTIATLAAYVSQAVQRAELLEERERASSTLQTAMLPRLPDVPDMALTARYRPAAAHDRVGGDWYDVVRTHGDETDLMIGDVAGHDIAAAAVMGEVRNMLRAFSFGNDQAPAVNVARLDEALERYGIDRFASLLYVRVGRPDGSGRRSLRWTNAGHFPPLLIGPDGATELLGDADDHDLVLGVDAAVPRRDVRSRVPEGSTLVLFTDGLVERRDECLSAGLERLRRSAGLHHGGSPDAVLDAIIQDMVGRQHEDDVAVLAARLGA